MNITIVLGTGRVGRFSEHIAKYVSDYLNKQEDVNLTYVDIRDFDTKVTIPAWETDNKESQKWKEIVHTTDAFIMVLPEYNHSFPGEFKVLLDMALKEYTGKKVVTVGVSAGGFGGTRVIESILPIYLQLGLRPILPSLNISFVQTFFGEEGSGQEEFGKAYNEKIEKMVESIKKL